MFLEEDINNLQTKRDFFQNTEQSVTQKKDLTLIKPLHLLLLTRIFNPYQHFYCFSSIYIKKSYKHLSTQLLI